MTNKLTLELDGSRLEFVAQRVLVVGYTGRDAAQVQAHIAELESQGIAPPERVPSLYALEASWVTTDAELHFPVPYVSGEVEPALLFRSDRLDDALVSVIVDFTDREEERRSIARSKLLPKPLSRRVWRYSDVAAVWDRIALRSWTDTRSDRELYQSGTLAQLLAPPDLLARLDYPGGLGSGTPAALEGTVLLMGTVPLRAREFAFTDYFACELETPDGRKLSYECRVEREKDDR